MSKKTMPFISLIVAFALFFGVFGALHPVSANHPFPEKQVLIVPYKDLDGLKFLVDHYDVV